MRSVRKHGSLLEAELDQFLGESLEFEERVESLIAALREFPLVAQREPPVAPSAPSSERPRVPPVADDDNLRRYLREVHALRRMERTEEVRLAKRLEFTRRRFRACIAEAQLRNDHLRSVLGVEFSRSCARDLRLPASDGSRPGKIGESCRRPLRAPAAEMDRLRAAFVERSLGVVADLALCYRTYGVPLMDLIQEGNGALIRAVEKFDWRKEVRFQTYATFWIRQAVERSIAFNKGIVRVPNYLQQKMRRLRREGVIPRRDGDVTLREMSRAFEVKPEVAGHLLEAERGHFSLDVSLDEDGESFASFLSDTSHERQVNDLEFPMLRDRLNEVMEALTRQERQILELRYGLGG